MPLQNRLSTSAMVAAGASSLALEGYSFSGLVDSDSH